MRPRLLVLGNLSAVGNISIVDLGKRNGETDQAFSGPLIDQNHNFVHYDIALDPHEVSYVCDTGIYNINGQTAFSGKNNDTLAFPSGTIAIAATWKIHEPQATSMPSANSLDENNLRADQIGRRKSTGGAEQAPRCL